MPYPYVEERDGNVYIGKTRVTLDSILIPWLRGETPAWIHEAYPTVPLADVYGTIGYYLEHQQEVDAWIEEGRRRWREYCAKQEAERPEFFAMMRKRFAEARERMGLPPITADEAADSEHTASRPAEESPVS